MPGITVQANFQATEAKLAARARGFAPDLEDLIDRVGRLIAVSLATSAVPYGISDKSRSVGESAVVRDIYRIYATPSQVYGEILRNGTRQQANGFYRAIRGGNIGEARGILSQSAPRFGLAEIGLFDGGALHRARRNNRGRISPSQKVLLIVTNKTALRQYVLDEVNKVGFGKAGWGNCARAFKETGATRGLPQWVTRHRNAPAAVAKDGRVQGTMIVTMFNQVPYAQNLLGAGEKAQAIGIGVDRLLSSMIAAERAAANAHPLS